MNSPGEYGTAVTVIGCVPRPASNIGMGMDSKAI